MNLGRARGMSGLADVVRLWARALAHGAPADGLPPESWIGALDPARRPLPQPLVLSAQPSALEIGTGAARIERVTSTCAPRLQAAQLMVAAVEVSDDDAVVRHVVRQRASDQLVPLAAADYEPLHPESPPMLALAPRSRWWPRLRQFAPMLAGGLDVGRLVSALARGGVPRHLPRMGVRGQHHHLWVLRDQSRAMVPFQDDFDALERDLRRHPVARCTTVRPFLGVPPEVPAGVDAVLVLSDLGAASSEVLACARGWQGWAQVLVGRGVAVQAWAPVSAAVVAGALARVLPVVPWHEGSTFRPCRGGRGVSTTDAEIDGALASQATMRLLPWLAPAQRVEPALLRRVRRAAGGAGRPEWESALWHGGPEVAAGEQVLQIRSSRVAHWRTAFERLTPAEQGAVLALLTQQHRHLPRSTLLTERLVWGVHAGECVRAANAAVLGEARHWLDRLAGQERRQRVTSGPPLHGEFLRGLLRRNAADAVFGRALEDVVAPLAAAVGLVGHNQGVSDRAWLAAGAHEPIAAGDTPWRLVWADPSGTGVLQRQGVGAAPPELAWPVLVDRAQGEALWRPVGGALQPLRAEVPAQPGTLLLSDAAGHPVAHRLDVLVRQPWQDVLGRDRHGVFCELALAGQRLRLRYLPPGTFLMGSPAGVGADGEHPQHPVTLTTGFWLADTPCTQAQWQAVMSDNPSHFKAGPDAPRRPVERVSWDDVQQFLQRLQAMLPPGCEAGLPTEAQWEYAARAGTTTAYWWGDELDGQRANMNDENGTSPVDRYQPNPWGLHDMHGNVWEWCVDDQRPYADRAERDPTGSTGGDARVVRGGSWFNHPALARSAFRDWWRRVYRSHYQGFRVLLRSSSPGPGGPDPDQASNLRGGAPGGRDPGAGRPGAGGTPRQQKGRRW